MVTGGLSRFWGEKKAIRFGVVFQMQSFPIESNPLGTSSYWKVILFVLPVMQFIVLKRSVRNQRLVLVSMAKRSIPVVLNMTLSLIVLKIFR